MGCGCKGASPGQLWEVVYADRTVSRPMSKSAATTEAARSGGYTREAGK